MLSCSDFWDHPRIGGEKFGAYAKIWNEWGSPPRGRGKAGSPATGSVSPGITPAWAGKSYRVYHCLASCWNHPRNAGKRWDDSAARTQCRDHPRMGGEKHLSGTTDNRPQGSPPRGRGKGSKADVECLRSRITPAWAGKSSAHTRKSGTSGDHPRVGGEKLAVRQQALFHLGSPPHGRGKAHQRRVQLR